MIIIIGLVILIAAVITGVAGVSSNSGSGHPLTHPFAVSGYHVTGSTGTLFLYGIVVGALGLAGLSLLLAGARRTSRRGRQARRGLTQSRRQTAAASQDRADLPSQPQTAPAYTVHDEQQNYTTSTHPPEQAAGPEVAAAGRPAPLARPRRRHAHRGQRAAGHAWPPAGTGRPSWLRRDPRPPAVTFSNCRPALAVR